MVIQFNSSRIHGVDMPQKPASAEQDLLEVEAILQFIIKSQAANDENADVIVPALAQSAKDKLADAILKLPK